jgi:hypothetical protein
MVTYMTSLGAHLNEIRCSLLLIGHFIVIEMMYSERAPCSALALRV